MAEAGRLQQRRVLITGAASGIGRRTALLFTAEGAALTLLDRSVEHYDGLGSLLRFIRCGAHRNRHRGEGGHHH